MIEKLYPNPINLQASSVYPFNEFSLQELLNKFFQTINECVESSNTALNFVKWLKEEGLPPLVEKEIEDMYNDGRLEALIDKYTKDLEKRVTVNEKEIVSLQTQIDDNNDETHTVVGKLEQEIKVVNNQLEQKKIDKMSNISNETLTDVFYKIATFGGNKPNGAYDIFIKVEDGTTEQYIEVKCIFTNKIENVSCKSPFIYSYSILGINTYRLIKQIKVMKDSGGEIFIAIQSATNNRITGNIRITNYEKENILTPIFEKYTGTNIGFTHENYFTQDYANISSGFQVHSALGFENTLTMRDNIVIYDDIIIYPESNEKYSSVRINNGSVIIENDNTYATNLGNYIYTDKSKYRLFANKTSGKFYLQVGNGDKNTEIDNKGYLEIGGWLGEQLKELVLNAETTIFKSDIRMDSRGTNNASSIFFYSDGGYSQIQQNLTNDELEIFNSDGSVNIQTSTPHMAKVNGRAILSAQSVTSTTRPSEVVQGYSVYDRTIGKPIWYNGTAWVDATGATV